MDTKIHTQFYIKGIPFILRVSLRLQIGKFRDYGLPKPEHGVLEAHPTLNSELLYRIRHGKVHPRPGVRRVEGKRVIFDDGQSEAYDTLLAATGYRIETPFFEKSFLDYEDSDRVELYLRMMHPTHKTLFFIGLFQPQGAIWPGSELQARLAARAIKGEWQPPGNLPDLAREDADEIERRFIHRRRHTIEVDYHEFVKRLKKQLVRSGGLPQAFK